MLEQLCTLYLEQKWAKYVIWSGALALGMLLFWLSGGFPPHVWRFLLQTLPLVPHLWTLKGSAILLPLLQLVAFSLALLCCWVFLAASIMWIAKQEWQYYREQRDFDASLERAEEMSREDLNNSDDGMQDAKWWEAKTEQFPNAAFKATGTSGLRAVPPIPLAASLPPVAAQSLTTTSRPPPGPKHLTFAIGTGLHTGIKRKDKPNEDNLMVIQGTHTYNTRVYPFGLFVVADGMGGHARGQEASRLAIQQIRDVVMPTLVSNAEIDSDHARELLLDGIQRANLSVYQHNQQQHINMGTTVTVANVGDSRTYLYRTQDGLQQITKDHSLVAQLRAQGKISEDDIYIHPQRNEIYRCIGEKASVQADTFSVTLDAETTLLLCSDGLWEMVRKPTLEQILREKLPDATSASKALIQAAMDGGGLDNVSVIVVHIASQASTLRLLPQDQRSTSPPLALNGWGQRS